MASHAAMPTPERIDAHHYRIYFSPRDERGRSHIGWLTIDIRQPTRVLDLAEQPCLEPGMPGTFDESGAMFSCIVRHEHRRWLFYTGWSVGVVTPWRTAIGLAYADVDADPPRFQRASLAPLLDRSAFDPFFVSNPFVRLSNGRWRMWYVSGTAWQEAQPVRRARYDVREAESANGLDWHPAGRVLVGRVHDGEAAIGRPLVLVEDGIHKMFYCYRGDTFGYRLGYAESADGMHWVRRDDDIRFDGAPHDWDNDGSAYPTIFDHDGQRFMLYCGNHYSRAGFGIAALMA